MPTIDKFSSLTVESSAGVQDFDMGYLLFTSGSLKKSLPYLYKSMQAFLKKKEFSHYFSCYFLLLQALGEMEEKNEARALSKEVENTCKTHKLGTKPLSLSLSAYYNIYEGHFDLAKTQLNSALKTAFDRHDHYLKKNDRTRQYALRFDIMICLYIYSVFYLETKDYSNCSQEIKNLQALLKDYSQLQKNVELEHSRTDDSQRLKVGHYILQTLKNNAQNLQRLRLGTKFIEALVELRHGKNYRQADRLLWELYEEANKTNNNFFIPYILCSMAWCHVQQDNKKQAQVFFNLAKKNVSEERKLLIRYMDQLEQEEKFNDVQNESYDLIFDSKDHIVVEKQKGCIEMKNQFILMDLLKLFLSTPGLSYSKEKIIKIIWKQDYISEVHDNKIYVTIKRLREIIEVDSCKPRYILRNSAGYYFSKQAKILVKS